MTAFSVTVFYREPTFEARIGRVGPPFAWTFTVHAYDAESAVALAREEFEEMARASSVGWTRVVVAWDITLAGAPEASAP